MMLRTTFYLAAGFVLSALASSCSPKAQADVIDTFEYCEIYLPERNTEEYELLGLKNLDEEWGIWGHNLGHVLPERPSETIYSKSLEGRYKKQYCFSSEELYNYIETYISNSYGSNDSIRFAILPNDNAIVCTCAKCTEAGNSHNDASPAVLNMITRLAKRFPNHMFFTSYYYTTKSLPETKLPDNVGVLISAIEFPLSSVETPKENEFVDLLKSWKNKVNRVYVWDYINNFDDYFTPYPVFDIMQRRIQIYEAAGVDGVFLNGSGYDFSTLSRLKTLILASIFKDPKIDWRQNLREKAKEIYPTTGDIISDFMIKQEDYVKSQGKELPFYGGVSNALKTYLPEEEFIAFHDALLSNIGSASSQEKSEINKNINAMELTRLEIMREKGEIEGNEPHLTNLKSLNANDGISYYSEGCWTVNSYVNDYEIMANHLKDTPKNLMKGVKIQPGNALDPEYSDLSILTDGLLGMPNNYHNGIVLNTPEEKWILNIPHIPGMRTLRIWLVTNPAAFRIDLPKRINLLSGNSVIGTAEPKISGDKIGHTYVDFAIPASAGSLTVTFARNKEKERDMGTVYSIGVEEIEGF